jgi:hypothetical protein
MDPGVGLLRHALDGDDAHRRPAHRLADRCSIRCVVLVPPHIRLRISRRDQPHLVPQLRQLTRPIVGRRTRLQPHPAGRQLGKERQHLRASQRPAHHYRPGRIHPVHLEDLLGDVYAHHANLVHGWFPGLVGRRSNYGTLMPGEGAIHSIIPGRPEGPDPETMNTGFGKTGAGRRAWIPGSRAIPGLSSGTACPAEPIKAGAAVRRGTRPGMAIFVRSAMTQYLPLSAPAEGEGKKRGQTAAKTALGSARTPIARRVRACNAPARWCW